jgi:hypothetical protein
VDLFGDIFPNYKVQNIWNESGWWVLYS